MTSDEEGRTRIKKYQTYSLKVDEDADDKAAEVKICSLARPHMRAFHFSWMGLFVSFLVFLAAAPLLGEMRRTLDLTKQEIFTSSICSVVGSIVIQVLIGPLCDKYGARLPMGCILMLSSVPTAFLGLVNGAASLAIVRLLIGGAGSTFVISQSWTSQMFSQEVVGAANGVVAGWGSLGSAFSQLFIGSFLFPLFQASMSPQKAWRIVSIVPAVIAFATGAIIIRSSDDSPKGNYKEMKKNGTMDQVSAKESFRSGAMNRNSWILYFQNACCSGAESAMNIALSWHLINEFNLSTEAAAALASTFGWMNLITRGLGGFTSDRLNAKMGMRGRIIWQAVCLVIEGVMVLVFSYTRSYGGAISVLVVFYVFAQACQGSTFGIVPYVNPTATGSVISIVSIGGSCGGGLLGLGFRYLDYRYGFLVMGATILASSALCAGIRVVSCEVKVYGNGDSENHPKASGVTLDVPTAVVN